MPWWSRFQLLGMLPSPRVKRPSLRMSTLRQARVMFMGVRVQVETWLINWIRLVTTDRAAR